MFLEIRELPLRRAVKGAHRPDESLFSDRALVVPHLDREDLDSQELKKDQFMFYTCGLTGGYQVELRCYG